MRAAVTCTGIWSFECRSVGFLYTFSGIMGKIFGIAVPPYENSRVGEVERGGFELTGIVSVRNATSPLIEPNGRISHIRLSGLIHRAAFHRAVVGSA